MKVLPRPRFNIWKADHAACPRASSTIEVATLDTASAFLHGFLAEGVTLSSGADSIFIVKRRTSVSFVAGNILRSRVTHERSARKDPLIFRRDTAFQLALLLTVRRRTCKLLPFSHGLWQAGALLGGSDLVGLAA